MKSGSTMTGDLWVQCNNNERHIGFQGIHQIFLFSNSTYPIGLYDNTDGGIFTYGTDNTLRFAKILQMNNDIRFSSLNKLIWYDKQSKTSASIWAPETAQHLYLSDNINDGTYTLHLGVQDNTHTLCPDVNGKLYLGTGNKRWAQIYSTNGSISTSDRNEKKDITEISDKYVELFKSLKPVQYKFKDGNSNRTHIGFIAQDVEDAMNKTGLSDLDFAGFCKDVKTIRNSDGEDEVVPNEYVYGLRYEEFIALNTKIIQNLLGRIEVLESKIN